MFVSDRSGSPQVYTFDLTTSTLEQRTTDPSVKVEACFSPKWSSATGGQILYTGVVAGRLKAYAIDMGATGAVTGSPRDLEFQNLPLAGCHPDWGQ